MESMLGRRPKPVMQYSAKAHPVTPTNPDAILPDLYLTDIFTARTVLLPDYHGSGHPTIRYILSALDNSLDQPKAKPPNRQAEFSQKLILMDDTPESDLLVWLREACDFIEESLAKHDGGVLVHCHLGQSRSASIVIAYIMRRDKLDYQAAFEKVKRKRSCIRPNPGFQRQLQMWHDMEYDINDAEGNRKQPYTAWRTEQKERARRLLSLS